MSGKYHFFTTTNDAFNASKVCIFSIHQMFSHTDKTHLNNFEWTKVSHLFCTAKRKELQRKNKLWQILCTKARRGKKRKRRGLLWNFFGFCETILLMFISVVVIVLMKPLWCEFELKWTRRVCVLLCFVPTCFDFSNDISVWFPNWRRNYSATSYCHRMKWFFVSPDFVFHATHALRSITFIGRKFLCFARYLAWCFLFASPIVFLLGVSPINIYA